MLFPFHRAAWQIAADPLRRLLNEPTEDEKNALTKRWKDSMQQELSMIGVTVGSYFDTQIFSHTKIQCLPNKGALVGSVVAASIAWSNAATQAGWAIVALWYIALVIALMAVSSATLQTVTLNRLISRPDGLSDIRVMLSGKPPTAAAQSVQPKRLQIYIWQIPLKLLNSSIYLFLVGLLALLWEAAALRGKELGYRDMKVSMDRTLLPQ